MSELKPCPFCGGEAVMQARNYNEYFPHCTQCSGKRKFKYYTEEEAITAWNTRAEPKPRVLTLKELRGLPIFDWVWIEIINATNKNDNAYKRKSSDYTKGEAFCCGWPGIGFSYDYVDYGKSWLAYDRKPE